MKNTVGIIKDIDNLGRVVIPKEYRTFYNLDKNVEVLGTEFDVLIRNPEYMVIRNTEYKVVKTNKNETKNNE